MTSYKLAGRRFIQMKNYKITLILMLSVLLVVALVLWLSRTKPVEVSVKAVAYGLVQDTVANTRAGTIKACRRAGISPSIGGQIARLPVKEGDTVQVKVLNIDQRGKIRLSRKALLDS